MTMMRQYLSLFLISFLTCTSAFGVNLDSLLPNERNTIEIFQKSASKVVFVHRIATVVNRSFEVTHVSDGAGSGILWDNEGHIVTNFHVVRGTDNLAVTIDNITVPVKVLGVEPRKDIAVLKIKSPKVLAKIKDIKPFELTHTSDLLVGQKTIAIGNPFGLDHTLTTGVISALGRQVPGIGGVTIRDMIQTDASVNPGNSGGPLLDSAGRLIGLNTMIYSNSGASAGIGFAVPADEIHRIVNQIIKYGRIVLAGIGIQRVEPNIAARLGVKEGILIAEVIPHTPADKAGLRGTYRNNWGHLVLGDVIVAVNGHPIKNYDALYNLLTKINVGDEISITVLRSGKKITHKIRTIDIAAY
ncbi:trypsin-like serine protease [Legionella israelensis]|uniref:S1C family serine protease n=1 Tax=Legionella israelensis TaxID=454 RepID=UPI00117F8593|nr:trypsin-like peptidase domain-containing protein [Legionella israelensis]QDP73662.1 trypsin-like serine protease [Legionella israelensis]